MSSEVCGLRHLVVSTISRSSSSCESLGLHAGSDAISVISFDTEDRAGGRTVLWSVSEVRVVLFAASMIITRQWLGREWRRQRVRRRCVVGGDKNRDVALSTAKLILFEEEKSRRVFRAMAIKCTE